MKKKDNYYTMSDPVGWRFTVSIHKDDVPAGARHLKLISDVSFTPYVIYEVQKADQIWPEHRTTIAVLQAAVDETGVAEIPTIGTYAIGGRLGPSVRLYKQGENREVIGFS